MFVRLSGVRFAELMPLPRSVLSPAFFSTKKAEKTDEKSRDENLKQHQQSKIVKGTVRKMFGEIPTDGKDAYKNQQKLMDNNLAFIKRKLDQELSDGTRKILQETSNPTPKTTMPSNQDESGDMSRQSGHNSVLEHIKLMKLPKYQIRGIVDRKNMNL